MDGILYVNKPSDWTSFDVVAKLRNITKTKSIGHTGTLDPYATGVLIVLVGKTTKALPYIDYDLKEYISTIKLGTKTDTMDIWGKIVEKTDVQSYTEEQIIEVLNSFKGASNQIPPMFSAIKVNGKKLYEYAREGKTVDVKPREIYIDEIEFLGYSDDEIKFRVLCSKGTYIRSLCEDIASKLNTIGCMSSLVRTKIGMITLDDCQTIEEISENPKLYSLYDILNERYTMIEIDDNTTINVKNGKKIDLPSEEDLICVVNNKQVIAMMEKTDNNLYKVKRGLWI